ncbi:hypothetical protein [Ruminococcus sp.]|uniref:hypothetical protein n=1 Tax=Ruminococcus sp. TaxID=41978 RepID=UPI0025F7854F|nr:hypothetical protein [Ruminococcus sp.]MBQ8965476.1 hypothetical protein [Ruminococcus sp.]
MKDKLTSVIFGGVFALSLLAAGMWNIAEVIRPKNAAHPMNWTAPMLLVFLAAVGACALTVRKIAESPEK